MTETRHQFIVLEGIDGCGKSTQAARLADWLRSLDRDVVASKEPTDGPWGQKLRASAESGRMPLEEELQAFIADRKQHLAELIEPALAAGKTVVLDRYYYSTVAYQGARGASITDLHEQMRAFAPEPDIVILLDLEPALALKRIEEHRGEVPNQFETLESLEKVRAIFRQLAEGDARIHIVNAAQTFEEIQNEIQQLITP